MFTVKDQIRRTQKKAFEEGIKEVRMFQNLRNITKSQVMAEVTDPTKPWLGLPKVGGTLRSLDFLTSDGY